jgi:glycosyltransferase involved in cell wall biosynthesis
MFSWESLYSIKVGGIAPHVSELSEALAREGHEIHIFTRQGNFDAYDKINGVHYQRVSSGMGGNIITQMDNMSDAFYDRFLAVQKIFGKFDILHGHDWHPVSALIKLKNNFGIPFILTMHSTEWGRGGSYKEIIRREKHGTREASKVIVTSKNLMNEVKSLYDIRSSKINIIPNGFVKKDINIAIDPARLKERNRIQKSSHLVLFCGRMTYQKGPDLLVEAAQKLKKSFKDLVFVFAGNGDLKEKCIKKSIELGVAGQCRFLGYVSDQEKEDLLNACDIVCVPSRNEPFGLVILEAWNAGKPVVATEAVSIIKNFEDGLLAYIQPESLAWCINRLIDNPNEMEKLSKAGKEKIRAEFDWKRIANDTESIYNTVSLSAK